MIPDFEPAAPLDSAFTDAIHDVVEQFLAARGGLVSEIGAIPLLEQASAYCLGGKRLRPAFCFWSHVAAAGIPDDPGPLLRAAASLDLLHASALVHDDLIDASETRRGNPSAHVHFAQQHGQLPGQGDAVKFGGAAAILLGDLLLAWSAELYDTCGLPADVLRDALGTLHAMRAEVTCGQYLDVAAAFGMTGAADIDEQLETSRRILEFKSARYSIRRPAQIGARLGGAEPALVEALGGFGSSLGHAFQLRDDVLGVFGDPDVTGKPAGDDLREGKRTLLVLGAIKHGTPGQGRALEELLGTELDEAQVAEARTIIEETGSLAATEERIEQETSRALAALDRTPMTEQGRTALVELTDLSVKRER